MSGLDIEYQIDGKPFFGYLADGSNGQKAPGILVIHQANGLSEHTKERTRRLGDLGYVAFALDMYGEVPATRDRAQAHLATVMDNPSLLRIRTNAGFNILKSCRNVDMKRLAAIGFCFGGSVLLEFVRDNRELACAVAFHPGLNWLPEKDDRKIMCKVMACIGIEDPFITESLREKFIELMVACDADWQLLIYGKAAHSFTDRFVDAMNIPGLKYHGPSDERSWAAMRHLFKETTGQV